jgi:hypothetical protein
MGTKAQLTFLQQCPKSANPKLKKLSDQIVQVAKPGQIVKKGRSGWLSF